MISRSSLKPILLEASHTLPLIFIKNVRTFFSSVETINKPTFEKITNASLFYFILFLQNLSGGAADRTMVQCAWLGFSNL